MKVWLISPRFTSRSSAMRVVGAFPCFTMP